MPRPIVATAAASVWLLLSTRDGVVVTVYILALVVFAIWLIVLAIGDAAATQIHYRRSLRAGEDHSDQSPAGDGENP